MKLVKCATRSLKKKRIFQKHVFYKASQLFHGTVHFVNVSFGGVAVSDSDYKTAIEYARMAAVPISQYAGQYGPNGLTIDPAVYTATMSSSSYTDADVQRMIEAFNFPRSDAVAVLSPTGANNTDAPLSQGVLGYHGSTGNHAYLVVNLEGSGLTIDDQKDVYVDALSHELAEMVIDPAADLSNPESNDPCSGNCGVSYRNYFDTAGKYLGGSPVQGYAFWTNGVATPATVAQCPSPESGCIYDPASPPINPQPNPPSPCLAEIERGALEIANGQIINGIDDLINGIICLFSQGSLGKANMEGIEDRIRHARTRDQEKPISSSSRAGKYEQVNVRDGKGSRKRLRQPS